VFYFNRVPHDRLLVAALQRQLNQALSESGQSDSAFVNHYKSLQTTRSLIDVLSTYYPFILINPKPHQSPSLSPSSGFATYKPSQRESISRFGCPVLRCSRSFGRVEHLRRHQQIHQNIKQHHCSICNKRFTRKDNLQVHVRVFTSITASECLTDISILRVTGSGP
jgi:uncharacterized Zn-finger protein